MTISYENLFRILKKKNIKPTWLIENSLITPGTMYRLRHNRNVSMYTLEILSYYLECDIFELFTIDLRDRKDDGQPDSVPDDDGDLAS